MEAMAVLPAGGLSLAQCNGTPLRQRTPQGHSHIRLVNRKNVSIRAVAAPNKQAEALQYRKLGDSDLVISEITLGTVSSPEQFILIVCIWFSRSVKMHCERDGALPCVFSAANEYEIFAFVLVKLFEIL
jgi:hypothetical protein